MVTSIMQGDKYAVPFVLQTLDGTLITPSVVNTVILNLGSFSRQYPGDVTYENGKWLMPLAQKQTFAMRGFVEPQARVEFSDGSIFGGAGDAIDVTKALNLGIVGNDGKKGSAINKNSTKNSGATGMIFIRIHAAGVEVTLNGAVRYDTPQELTKEQKEQARKNIGADKAGTGAVLYDQVQNLTAEQKLQARENIGAGTSNFDGSYNSLTDKPEPYEIPVASEEVLGGVKAIPKADGMTEQVGIDENGVLWYKPGSGGTSDTPTADEVLFTKDLVLTERFGRYTPVNGKVTVPAEDKSVQAVILDAFSQDKNPTITQPSVGITFAAGKAYEVGTSVTTTYAGTFNPGSYSYGPATGVTVSTWKATNNVTDEVLDKQSGKFANYIVADGANYRVTVNGKYTDGAIPLSALGAEYAEGQIKSGSKTATSSAITGYRNSFYGTTTDKEVATDSSVIRRLAQKSNRAYSNGSTFTLNVPVGALRVIIAYPATLRDLTSVKDVNGLNADITSAFVQSTVEVEGASSYLAIPYKVYTLDFANPNDAKNTYTVTI